MPRRDRGFRAGGTDGRARWGRAVSEGLILHAVPYGSLIIAKFHFAKAKKSLNCVCPAGRERSYGGMPKAGRCPKYTFFDICKENRNKKRSPMSKGERSLRGLPRAISCAARRTRRRRSSDAGLLLVYVPKLRFSSKYSEQLRSPQQEVSLLPGTPWKI